MEQWTFRGRERWSWRLWEKQVLSIHTKSELKCVVFVDFVVTRGLRRCAWPFLVVGSAVCSAVMRGLLSAVAPLVAEHGFSGVWASVRAACGLSSCAHGLSCSTTCGIFPDQGSNPCALHWQADSYLLCH